MTTIIIDHPDLGIPLIDIRVVGTENIIAMMSLDQDVMSVIVEHACQTEDEVL
jgi:hypothetical protein